MTLSTKSSVRLVLFALTVWGILYSSACAQKPMQIIDTHIHLYDTERQQGVPWPDKSSRELYKPHLPADYKAVVKPLGVTAAVIVEASPWVEDNAWLLELIENDAFFLGVVGNLDPGSDDFASQLERFAQNPRFRGIRPRDHRHLKLSDPRVEKNLRELAKRNLTLDLLVSGITLDEIAALAERIPQLRIVVNHVLGKQSSGKPLDEAYIVQVRNLAKRKNVYCKVSGLVEQVADRPASREVAYYRPLLDLLWQEFGEDRLLFASNWPVSNRGADYDHVLSLPSAYLRPKGQAAIDKVFWKNAVAVYGLKLPD